MTRTKKTADELRERALGALLTDAFFTWPSALVIALTIIAFFSGISLFPGFQPWFWLIIGAVLELIYLVVTINDPTARQQAISRMLEEKYDPRDIRNLLARQRLQKALEYKRIIDGFIAKQAGALRVTLEDTASQIEQWIEQIYLLAKSIDTFESNPVIDRDRREVPTQLRSLETRLKLEQDPAVKAELEEAIAIRRSLLNDLQKVASLAKRTEIKMDNTVAQLSSIHTKLQQMAQTRQLDSTHAQRLNSEIQSEVQELSDILSAMEDVYAPGGYSQAVAKLSDASEPELDTSLYSEDDAAQRRSRQ